MKRLLLFFCFLLSFYSYAQQVESTWESLNQRGYPQWFCDAKLGVFIHWGLYSVPAYASKEGYAEWFYRGLMEKDSGRCQIMSCYADTTLPTFEQYKMLTKHWHAELWNPQEWVRKFKEAGAKYVVLVTKHHDGYSLWNDSYQPEWNSVVSGPRRNIVEELTAAVRNEGLRMGFYYSLPEWTNTRHIWMQSPDSAISDYVDNYMIPQFKELVSRYKPSLIFADGDWLNSAEQFHSKELIAWYYNLVGPEAIVNDRWGNGTQHGFKTPEYSDGIRLSYPPWAECRGIGRSFGYNRNEDLDNFLTDHELIQHFCKLVAAGGGLTLNVGPLPDGTIPFIQQERLRALGRWMQVNGEAIYGSHCYGVMCEDVSQTEVLPPTHVINCNWVRNAPLKGMPVDNFNIRWEGVLSLPKEGDYIFRIQADDEAMVTYHAVSQVSDANLSPEIPPSSLDTLLYYNHAWAENAAAQKTIHLDKDIWLCVDYREKELEATIRLEWSRDGGKSFELVPAKWHTTANWKRTVRCFTRKDNNIYLIEFERPGRNVTVSGIPQLQKNTVITLLGTSATLRWKQDKNGTLTISLDNVDPKEYNELNHAWTFKIAGAANE